MFKWYTSSSGVKPSFLKWDLRFSSALESSAYLRLRPRLYGEKLSRVEGSPAYPSYPGRGNISYISLQNLANRLHEKQKVGSARRVTRLAGSPFCDGGVTLLAGPTFLHINTLARLAGSTPSRRDNQSMRELCCPLLVRAKGSTFFSYKRSVKLTRLGRVTLLPGTTFLHINRA